MLGRDGEDRVQTGRVEIRDPFLVHVDVDLVDHPDDELVLAVGESGTLE